MEDLSTYAASNSCQFYSREKTLPGELPCRGLAQSESDRRSTHADDHFDLEAPDGGGGAPPEGEPEDGGLGGGAGPAAAMATRKATRKAQEKNCISMLTNGCCVICSDFSLLLWVGVSIESHEISLFDVFVTVSCQIFKEKPF